MKKYYFLLLSVSFLIISCSNNAEISPKEDLTDKILKAKELSLNGTDEFQILPRPVNYFPTHKLPKEVNDINEITIQKDLAEGQAFVFKSGFPDYLNKEKWMQENTFEVADKKYRSYLKENQKHDNINAFRQYATQLILIDYKLLANNDEKSLELIAFYTKELIESKAKSFELIAYCFNKLEHNWTGKEISNYAKQIIDNYNNDSELILMKKSLEATKLKLTDSQNENEIVALTKGVKVQKEFLKELEEGIAKIKEFQ